MDKIFVQIASYRDYQLVPTIRNAIEKAKYPKALIFGVNWQRDDKESLEEFVDHPQVRYLEYDYRDSQGLGWARSEVAKLWRGEPYTLQLDSHHRFAQDWDEMMMADYKQATKMCDKPILTTYLTPFVVSKFEESGYDGLEPTPSLMSQYEFSSDRLLMSMPWFIQDFKDRTTVIPARTLSGHFYFVKSDFIKEVPYDPEIYFGGYCEETTMSVRAWTHGYDFYSPYRQYIWHEYTREGRPKHWDDHGKESKTEQTSGKRDAFSRKKTRQIFDQEDSGINIGIYGLGDVRTLHEYEVFGGFDFKNNKIQEYTLKVNNPPNPTPWEDQFKVTDLIDVTVSWDIDHFKDQSDEYKVITLGILDKFGKELYRADFTPEGNRDIHGWQINSHVAKIPADTVGSVELLMWGLKLDDTWSTPYKISIH